MDLKGQRRYFHEFLFYRATQVSPAWNAKTRQDVSAEPMSAERAKEIRARLDERLADASTDMDTASPGQLLRAMDQAFADVDPGHRPMFAAALASDAPAKSRSYAAPWRAFRLMTGLIREADAEGNPVPVVPEGGVRVPVSPYDPRWADRETVAAAGTSLVAVHARDARGGSLRDLHMGPAGPMYDLVPAEGPAEPLGPAMTDAERTAFGPRERRYFYEYVIYQAIEKTPDWSTSRDPEANISPLTASHGRAARQRIGEVLAERGYSMDRVADLPPKELLRAIDDGLERAVEGHQRLFDVAVAADDLSDSAAWRTMVSRFDQMTGTVFDEGGYRVEPDGGSRIPVSPYDPRWSTRDTVLNSGTRLLAVPVAAVADVAWDDIHRLQTLSEAVELVSADTFVTDGVLERAGTSYTKEDASGMAALRGYMSESEYRDVSDWVASGAMRADGSVDYSKFMSAEATDKAVAILEHLSAEGIGYEVKRDLKRGQARVRLEGTRMDIRLVDLAEDENYIGRIYDDGAIIRYSVAGTRRTEQYNASTEETLRLIDWARGKPMERTDGKGLVGVRDLSQTPEQQREDNKYYSNRGVFKVGGDLSVSIDNTNRSARWRWFKDADDASEYLNEVVSSARARVAEQLDVEGMLAEYEERGSESDFTPEISGHDSIAAIRADYARMLAGEDIDLIAPGYTLDDYEVARSSGNTELADFIGASLNPALTVPEKIRVHSEMVVDAMVGTVEPSAADGKRFDPVAVSTFMDSDTSVWRNNDNLIGAMRMLGIEADELRGTDFYNRVVADRLLTFDEETSRDMLDHDDPTIAGFGEVIEDSLSRYGSRPLSVRIDDNGVVKWQAERLVPNGKPAVATGYIGQILPRGEYGEITTKFAGSVNHMFVPGYMAAVVPQVPGETKTLEERTRLRGYEQVMADAIRYQIRNDVTFDRQSDVGETTSLNSVVRNLYDTRHPVDFFESSAEEGLSVEDRAAILRTEALRVRYPSWLGEGSNAMAHARAERYGYDERNDNRRNPLVLTGNRNISVLDVDASRGMFDPIMTGMAGNQGVVRYLLPSASVDAEGMIIPGDPEDRVPVATMTASAEMGYDPHDRQNMTFSNIMQSSAVVRGARTAMTQMHGWNFEDGIVISREFAAAHQIRDIGGAMRDLKVGDKLSDFHGNKGVVSLIVDREMEPEAAAEAGLEQEVAFFRDNPDLEVVMSPFSAISRFNGGTARELMDNPGDLEIGGETVSGGVGDLNLIVTHMAVDAKTTVYDAEAVRAGKGRKVSSQLAWALQAQGCSEEFFSGLYGTNTSGIAKAREYLVALGYDLTPTGELRVGYDDVEGEERKVFAMFDPSQRERTGRLTKMERSALLADFGSRISASGGVMELPFPITMASGEKTPEAVASDDSGRTVYHLPVLSSYLRSEQDLGDGSVSRHDHTRHYMKIYETVAEYEAKVADGLSPAALQETLSTATNEVQSSYDALAGRIVSRQLEHKRNMFKEAVMSHRVPNSASAVWSGDPRLDVDEVAMNSTMARELGYGKGDDRVLLWRDPVLRGGAVRYLRMKIDDSLEGVAVNPVVVKSMDGDFDGDSVGLVGNLPPATRAEALEHLTVEGNLLDKGNGVRGADGKMTYPLALHDSLDVQVAAHANPELGERLDGVVAELNALDSDYAEGNIARGDLVDGQKAMMEELNGIYREAFANDKGVVSLRFDSMDAHMESVAQCHRTGAKGSPGKLEEYGVYLGAKEQADGSWVDVGKPTFDSLRERYAGSQLATALKDQFTGIAGTRSQSVVQLLRPQGMMQAACETGYPASQAMLQAKHDPIDAAYRAETLNGAVNDLWSGLRLDKEIIDGRYRWSRVMEDGKPAQATKEQWTQQFVDMYTAKEGMGVSVGIDQIEAVASALSDENGVMRPTDRESWASWPKEIQPLPLDQLAYRGGLADLDRLAREGANLFEGENAKFAPNTVARNKSRIIDMMHDNAPIDEPLLPIGPKDVAAGYEPKMKPNPTRVKRPSPVPPKKIVEPEPERAAATSEANIARMRQLLNLPDETRAMSGADMEMG